MFPNMFTVLSVQHKDIMLHNEKDFMSQKEKPEVSLETGLVFMS